MTRLFVVFITLWWSLAASAQPADLIWESPSLNSAGSMPCGGCDVGMNVWVENDGDIRFYLCRSGSFDENNTLLKAGLFRLHLSQGLDMSRFRQVLHLHEGYVTIGDGNTEVEVWADVSKPVVHVEVSSRKALKAHLEYSNWRSTPRTMNRQEGQQCSYKWTVTPATPTTCDTVRATGSTVLFYHHNPERTVFDYTAEQQGMEALKPQMYNPLSRLIFGGRLSGLEEETRKYHHFQIALASLQGEEKEWLTLLSKTEQRVNIKKDKKNSRAWWRAFWQRSFIETTGATATMSRNYELFRFLLGCNAMGDWPTKFNGGLFTFDPSWVDGQSDFTPDFRKWGGGTHTAQNQRLVYWPMLRSGDFDLMKPQFEFYRRILENAELRSRHYWNHEGACFTEQVENFGLPNPAEYGGKRPAGFDPGLEYNAWLEYEWDTVLEFCQMILLCKDYAGADITPYLPMVRSCLRFFDEHYQYLSRQRGRKALDEAGHLVIYPGSACETYKMAYNPASTIAALLTVSETYMQLVDTAWVVDFHQRIPSIPYRRIEGKTVIAPAIHWERVNNVETPQLYPVFPWCRFGVGHDSLDIARDTYFLDPDAVGFRSHEGWKQDNIWAACLGLTDEALRLNRAKLAGGPFRYPAFWGPGFDWAPDHNWGGSGMIGLQQMLLQEADGKILLFPAWPKGEDVHFKLHAGRQTTVEATLKGGQLTQLEVTPKEREKDIIIWP